MFNLPVLIGNDLGLVGPVGTRTSSSIKTMIPASSHYSSRPSRTLTSSEPAESNSGRVAQQEAESAIWPPVPGTLDRTRTPQVRSEPDPQSAATAPHAEVGPGGADWAGRSGPGHGGERPGVDGESRRIVLQRHQLAVLDQAEHIQEPQGRDRLPEVTGDRTGSEPEHQLSTKLFYNIQNLWKLHLVLVQTHQPGRIRSFN